MTVTLNLPTDTERRLRLRAAQEGKDISDFLLDLAERESLFSTPAPISDEEFERVSDEIADIVGPDIPPLSDEAVSRSSFYEGRY